MCRSGCSGRDRTKCYRPKRSGVNVITHKGQDAFCVCVCAKKCGMMRVGVCQGVRVYIGSCVCGMCLFVCARDY